jgi:hypothetical protein
MGDSGAIDCAKFISFTYHNTDSRSDEKSDQRSQ